MYRVPALAWSAPSTARLLAVASMAAASACGGGYGSGSGYRTGPTVGGKAFDGAVSGATIALFELAPAGTLVLPALATATTAADGSYSLAIPPTATAPLELTSTGGTYKDDVTGAVTPAPDLAVIVTSFSGTSIAAQLTPLTTLEAQVATAMAATSGGTPSVATFAAGIDSALGAYLGVPAPTTTPLVDVTTAGCASAASQASQDASLAVAALAQLASTYGVTVGDLVLAVAQDLGSDGVLDGMAKGAPLTVPLSGGTVQLCTIEGDCPGAGGSGFAQQLLGSMNGFVASAANLCKAAPSSSMMSAMGAGSRSPHFFFTVGASFPSIFGGGMVLELDGQYDVTVDSSGPVTFPLFVPSGATYDVTVKTQPPGQACTPVKTTGTVTANVDVPITCNLTGNAYQVSFQVSGLLGSGFLVSDGFGELGPTSSVAAFVSPLAAGSPYTISVVSQPTNPDQVCTVTANGSGVVSSTSITSPAQVTCSSSPSVYAVDGTGTLFAFDASGKELTHATFPGVVASLDGGGLTADARNVYLTLGASTGGSQGGVLAFDRSTLAPVTLASGAFGGVATPRGIAWDPHDSRFFVGNGGSTVTVYDANGAYLSAFPNGPTADAIYGPSGVAFDATTDTLWVANYTGGSGVAPSYGVAQFTEGAAVAQTINPATQFIAPMMPTSELPYSIAACVAATSPRDVVVVGFRPSGGSGGSPQGGIYATSGSLVAPFTPQLAAAGQPNAISCSSTGVIYVASDDGLHLYSMSGAGVALPSGGFAALSAPVYGVLAVY